MLERFRAAFADASSHDRLGEPGSTEIDLELGGAFRIPTSEDLRRLGPFGQAFPAPLFAAFVMWPPVRLRASCR